MRRRYMIEVPSPLLAARLVVQKEIELVGRDAGGRWLNFQQAHCS